MAEPFSTLPDEESPQTKQPAISYSVAPTSSEPFSQLPPGDEPPPIPGPPPKPDYLGGPYVANAMQGLRNSIGTTAGSPNSFAQLGDYLLGQLGAGNEPGFLTRHTYSPEEINNAVNQTLYTGPVARAVSGAVNAVAPGSMDESLPASAYQYKPETLPGKIGQDILATAPTALIGSGAMIPAIARQVANAGSVAAADTAGSYLPNYPSVQILAGLLGSYPGARLQGPIIPTMRGTTNAAQDLQGDFNTLGIPSNIAASGQNRTASLMAQVGSWLPFVGPAVRGSIEKTLSGTGGAADRLATGMGAAPTVGESVSNAGNAAQSAITNYARGEFPTVSGQLYDSFFNRMTPTQQIPLPNTLNSLGSPVSRFPTNPDLGRAITNPKLQQYFDALAPKTTQTPAVYSSVLDASGNPILLQASQKIQQGGSLTFPELKELRSKIGRDIADPMLVSDIPRADLEHVYAGMSQDLEDAARAQGPEALSAFKMANLHYQAGKQLIDQLQPILADSGETSFAKLNNAASATGASANPGLLNNLKRVMAPDDWNSVGAAVIKRMGTPTPGAKDVIGAAPDFSASTFATNWNKVSDAAKDALFGNDVAGSNRANLEALARVSQAQKNVGKLANSSHSAEHMGLGGLVIGGLEQMAENGPRAAIPWVAGAVGANVMARGLMNPAFSRWLYRTSELTGPQAKTQAVTQLLSTARLNTALQPIANQLSGNAQQ